MYIPGTYLYIGMCKLFSRYCCMMRLLDSHNLDFLAQAVHTSY